MSQSSSTAFDAAPQQAGERAAVRLMRQGAVFQLSMMAMFIWRVTLAGPWPESVVAQVIFHAADAIGSVLFFWCLYNLYIRRRLRTGLITTGPFRWTRHPMYCGMLLMDLPQWCAMPLEHAWTGPAFVFLLAVAGWFQERETLARFGAAATAYYARTPRLPFFPVPRATAP